MSSTNEAPRTTEERDQMVVDAVLSAMDKVGNAAPWQKHILELAAAKIDRNSTRRSELVARTISNSDDNSDCDRALMAANPRLQIINDNQDRLWLVEKFKKAGYGKQLWWARPLGMTGRMKSSGATIVERDKVLNDVSNEWINEAWSK